MAVFVEVPVVRSCGCKDIVVIVEAVNSSFAQFISEVVNTPCDGCSFDKDAADAFFEGDHYSWVRVGDDVIFTDDNGVEFKQAANGVWWRKAPRDMVDGRGFDIEIKGVWYPY